MSYLDEMDELLPSNFENIKLCRFCDEHELNDVLYEMSEWDGGIGFDYIRNIKYCPLCGAKLLTYEGKRAKRWPKVSK